MSREDFSTIAGALLPNHRSIRAFVWAPEVKAEQRDSIEHLAAYEGLNGFKLIEHVGEGIIIDARERKAHFPVYYAEPQRGNEKTMGYDLNGHPGVRSTLKMAKETGEASATGGIRFFHGNNAGQTGVLLVEPIFDQSLLRGFVIAVLQLENLADGAVRHLQGLSNIVIEDITETNSPEFLLHDVKQRTKTEKSSDIGVHYRDSRPKLAY